MSRRRVSEPVRKPCEVKPALQANWNLTVQEGSTTITAHNNGKIILGGCNYGSFSYGGPVTMTLEDAECLMEQLDQAIAQVQVWNA